MSFTKNYFKYISLSILGMIGVSCYILADTYFIADKLGEVGLASLNLALPLFCLVNGIGLLLGVGGATIYNIYTSSNNTQKANSMYSFTIICGAFFSTLFILLGLFAMPPITHILGATDKVIYNATYNYGKILLCFSPFFIFNNIFMAFMRNDNAPRRATIGVFSGSISNIIMDYILIYILNLGMTGAALATAISPLIGIILCLTRKNNFHFIKSKVTISDIKKLLSAGMFSLIGEYSSMIVMYTFNMLILGLTKETGVAAYGIVANIAFVATAFFSGLGQGLQPLCSHAYGNNNKKELKKSLQYGKITALIIGLFIFIVVYIFKVELIQIFNSQNNKLLFELANDGIIIYFTNYIIAGINYVYIAYYAATGNGSKSTALSLIRGVFAVVFFAILLSKLFGMLGIWLTILCSEGVTLLTIVSINIYKGIKNKETENYYE